jgi:hypothetical protein
VGLNDGAEGVAGQGDGVVRSIRLKPPKIVGWVLLRATQHPHTNTL